MKKDLVGSATDKSHVGNCIHYASFNNIQCKEEVVVSRSGKWYQEAAICTGTYASDFKLCKC